MSGVRRAVGLEASIAAALEKLGSASASRIALELYPGDSELRVKLSKVSVTLRRMEKKGLVIRGQKEAKGVPYSLNKAAKRPEKEPAQGLAERLAWLEHPIREVLVEKEEKAAVRRVPVGEKVKRIEAKQIITKVTELKVTEEPQLSERERILQEIRHADECTATVLAERLKERTDKGAVSSVTVQLHRLEKEGLLESRRTGRRRLFRIKEAVERPVEKRPEAVESTGLEGEVLNKLKVLRRASASEIADQLFENATREDTNKVYVTLQRLGEKELLHKLGREGRKTYFSVEKPARWLRLPEFELPELPSMSHIRPVYTAVGLSVVVVALVFYNFGGGFGLFAVSGENILQLTLEQQQAGDLQSFVYGVKNVNSHPVSDVRVEAILPEGSELTEYGNAQVSERNGLTVLTWLLAQINPNEKDMFNFAGIVPGQIQLYAEGLSEQEKEQIVPVDVPIQAILPAGESNYKQLEIEPVGYLWEIGIQLSAGPEGTGFSSETVAVKDIPIPRIIQNITIIPVNEPEPEQPVQPPEQNITPSAENITPPVQPPVENVTPVIPPATPSSPPPEQNLTSPIQSAENVTPPPVQPPETQNLTAPPAQPTENATPSPEQPAQTPIENATPPTGGIVTPSVTPPEEQQEPEPLTTIRIYLDPDTELNGNEDLIGEKNLSGTWDGSLKVQLPRKKYGSSMNLMFYSDKGAVVLVKSLELTWMVEVPVNASQNFIAELYANLTQVSSTIKLKDSKGDLMDSDILIDGKSSSNRKQTHELKTTRGKHNLKIIPANKPVKELTFEDVQMTANMTIGLDDVPESIARPANVKQWLEVYALDTGDLDFMTGSFDATAKGNALFKCAQWNFASQSCSGTWDKIMYLTPGQQYTVPISPGDPGYGEANITIINVQSYPTVGGNWTVMFNTTGTADLKITAINGTAWSNVNENNDLKFLEVKCGNIVKSYAWINNSVIITNYACNENGNETSKVLTEGSHYLEFDFGGDVKHAKNYAVYEYQNVRTVSGTEEWCGDVTDYDKIVVTSTGKIQICPRNASSFTGWLNITMPGGNFTIENGGLVNGTGRGATGGAGHATTQAYQGMPSSTWVAGRAHWVNNASAGGGGGRAALTTAAGGGGGGFGGAGGRGGNETGTTARYGWGGEASGSASSMILLAGSGGGGGAGDHTSPMTGKAGNGGAGFKVDAGAGTIIVAGIINVTGTEGQDDLDNNDDEGAGGGGSGGHVILKAYMVKLDNAVIDASGGRGGNVTDTDTDDCGGGGGGGGRIAIFYGIVSNVSANVQVLGGQFDGDSCSVKPLAGGVGSIHWNATLSFGNAAVYSINMTAPSSSVSDYADGTFVMNCTPRTGGLPANVNLSYEYNMTNLAWRAIPTSGTQNLTISTGNGNPEQNVTNNTLYTATVTMNSVGSYNVRCRLSNSTYSVNSTSQVVTVKGPVPLSVTLHVPSGDSTVIQNNNFVMTCSALTNGAPSGINIAYQYNTSGMAWTDVPASGTVNLTASSNPYTDISNNTNYTTNVDPMTAGTYNVRCRAYNSSTSIYSSTRQVTVTPHMFFLNVTSPLQSDPVQVTGGQNITVRFNFTMDGSPIEYGINVTNITVGGQVCILTGAATEDWPMDSYNLQRTSYTSNSIPTNISVLHASNNLGEVSSADNSPVVWNGYVYVGTKNNITFQLDANDISIQVANFSMTGNVLETASVANGYVYIGADKFHQLNANDISQQIAVFDAGPGMQFLGSAVTSQYVYVCAYNSNTNTPYLYQLSADDVSQSIVNRTLSKGCLTPAVAYGYLYPGQTSGSSGETLQLDASNISVVIANITSSGTFSIADGYAYHSPVGSLYQSNASNISQLINSRDTFWDDEPTGIAYGYAYVPAMLGGMIQVNASNVSIYHAGDGHDIGLEGAIGIAGGYVFASGDSNAPYLFQLDASNINTTITNTSVTGYGRGSVVIANGYIYFYNDTGMLFQLGDGAIPGVSYNTTTKLWQANCTVPSGLTGLQDMAITVESTAYNNFSTDTELNSVQYLTFNYTIDITDPTTASPVSVSGGDRITVNFTFNRNGVPITTDVNVTNITIGGQDCAITPPFWAYRRNITVTNNMDTDLTSYQVNLTINTSSLIEAGKMNPDCSDIRFYNSSGNVIDFWLEDGTCNLTNNFTNNIWVEVPNIPASGAETITMYYGNPSATNASNITSTFLFGDDFNDGTIDTTKWNTSAPMRFIAERSGPFASANTGYNPIQENDGFLNFSGKRVGVDSVTEDGVPSCGWLGQSLMSNVSISESNFTIETEMWENPFNNTPCWWQYLNQSDLYLLGVGQDHQNWLYAMTYSQEASNYSYAVSWISDASFVSQATPNIASKSVWKRVTLEFINGNAKTRNTTFYIQPKKLANISLGMTYSTRKVYIATANRNPGADLATACSAEDKRVDWFFVRKFAETPPSSAMNTEEQLPSIWYDNGWHANCTVPSGLSGLQDLYVEANSSAYSNSNANDTEPQSVEYPAPTVFTYITSSNVGSNTTMPAAWSGVALYANWTTNATNLGWAVLATNETGSWQNKSGAIDIDASTLTWSNFSWRNDSVDGSTVVGWRIYANNSDGKQNVTAINTFTVGPSLSITMINSTVDFGTMSTGTLNNTTTNNPSAFSFRNDGNVRVNVTINATDLFTESPNPSTAYRAAANVSTEGTSYIASCTNTSWFNMPAWNNPTKFMCFLGWLDSSDQAETEIAVAVPGSEGIGTKSSTVTFIFSQA